MIATHIHGVVASSVFLGLCCLLRLCFIWRSSDIAASLHHHRLLSWASTALFRRRNLQGVPWLITNLGRLMNFFPLCPMTILSLTLLVYKSIGLLLLGPPVPVKT